MLPFPVHKHDCLWLCRRNFDNFHFSRFFNVFWSKNLQKSCIYWYTRLRHNCGVLCFDEILVKMHEKSRKNENYQNSFDKVINNHVYVPETEAHIIWCISRHFIREKSITQLNLGGPKSVSQETYYGWISLIFGQKINGFIDFFCLLEYFASPQNHEYWIDFNFERRKSHLLLERCPSSASNTTFFHLIK